MSIKTEITGHTRWDGIIWFSWYLNFPIFQIKIFFKLLFFWIAIIILMPLNYCTVKRNQILVSFLFQISSLEKKVIEDENAIKNITFYEFTKNFNYWITDWITWFRTDFNVECAMLNPSKPLDIVPWHHHNAYHYIIIITL